MDHSMGAGHWLWQAGINQTTRYGDFGPKSGQKVNAHRMAYLLHHGVLPEGVVRHTCHVQLCVNPAHLIAGTKADNQKDMVEAGRSLKGSKNSASKLKEEFIPMIRQRYFLQGQSLTNLAKEFGVTKQAIAAVVNGKTWKHA
jgi:hypothetical protein